MANRWSIESVGATRVTPPLNILKTNDEKRLMNLEISSQSDKMKAKRSGATLRALNSRFNKLFERIYNIFDLKEDLVRNVIAYAKCLPIPGTNVIDRNIFNAQMQRHFNLTNSVLLDRMYEVCCPCLKTMKVGVVEYIELMCLFMTKLQDYRVQFVFNVYNTQGDGHLTRTDLKYFIQPMVSRVNDDSEFDVYEDRPLKDFVNMLMEVVDRNHDKLVSLDEFRYLVKKDILMMECLGPCLPTDEHVQRFVDMFEDKSNLEVTALFRFERRISLCEPSLRQHHGIQRFFPVTLELP